jgi:hypothetical protein
MSATVKVVAALPTRGFIYARTLISLQRNEIDGLAIIPGQPIPDCHNLAVREALKEKPTHVWIVEEDMEYPDGTLQKMLDVNAYITVCNYSLGQWRCMYRQNGKISFGGTGCMLVRSEVFDQIPYPWFETDKTFDIRDWRMLNVPNKYGGQDVYFCWKARQMGLEIKEVKDFHVNHLRIKNMPKIETNTGYYDIFALDWDNAKEII